MPDHDHIGVATKDADRVLYLLAFDLGRECSRVFGRQHTSAETVHGSFE